MRYDPARATCESECYTQALSFPAPEPVGSGRSTLSPAPDDFTRLLNLAAAGDPAAAQEVLPKVIQELRVLARARMAKLPPGQTLQPTALVNEAWLRLATDGAPAWEGRRHFYFVAARAMRDILVEDARRKGSEKRGGQYQRIELSDAHLVIQSPIDDVLALDQAMKRLEATDPEGARIVLLRFFAGLEMTEIAETLEVSLSTVERKWRFVRAWLKSQLAVEP